MEAEGKLPTSSVPGIVPIPTSIAAFVGACAEGPMDEPHLVRSWGDYERLYGGLDGGDLGYAVRGFYANGGDQAWIVRTEATVGDEGAGTGIYALERVDLFNLLCLPGLRRLDGAAYLDAAAQAAAYCRRRLAFLILDVPETVGSVDSAVQWAQNVASALGSANTSFAAAYWPEVLVPDPLAGNTPRAIGPSGMVAGIYGATDSARGIWQAPAGIEAALADAVDLSVRMTDAENGLINPVGLNALRLFPTYGAVVWGARTLQGADLLGSDWKYVPVRRTASYIEQSLARGLKWTSLEPNAEPLWSAIRLAVGSFMTDLFRQGAFAGSTTSDSYFVSCDSTTTTPTDIEAGIVNLVLGFAPATPAEFVVLQLQLQAAAD